LLSSLLWVSSLLKTCAAQSSSSSEISELTSSVCTTTTGLYAIYTSDSSTYLIQEAGRTGQAVSSCPADATSTVFEVSTVWQTNSVATVYRSSTYYVSNLSTIACGLSGNASASINCPYPTTVTLPAPTSGSLFDSLSQISTSTIFQQGPCLPNASAPATVTYSDPNCVPSSDLSSYLSSQPSTCSSIANISAIVTSRVSGSLVSSVIHGTALCPIIFDSSPRSGSGLTVASGISTSTPTVYDSASCQVVSTLPPITTSVYLSNLNCSGSTVFSTILQSGPTGGLFYPNSSCPTCPSGVLTITNAGAITTIYTDGASCTAGANASASTITLSQSFVSTVYTQDPSCGFSNTSSLMGPDSVVSATRYTTIYGPDVTVTMSNSSATPSMAMAYCATCPDACYVDFNDDGVPDAQENSNSTAPPPVVVADNGFENGTSIPLNQSSSSPDVTAQIAQGNGTTPLAPQSGNSYL
jgi:hypothetical protein